MNPQFQEASEAAEEVLDFILTAEQLSNKEDQIGALRCLRALSAFSSLHAPVIRSMELDLARVAVGPITIIGPSGPSSFASAHAALYFISTSLELLSSQKGWTVPPDLRDWLGIDSSMLRTLLIQERAKLVGVGETAKPSTKRRKPGRTSKEETDTDSLVYKALCSHHKYSDGKVEDYQPIGVRKLGEKYNLANNAFTNFLHRDKRKQYDRKLTHIGSLQFPSRQVLCWRP